MPPEAKEIISALLMQNPLDRLGTAGSFDVKEHHYFFGVDWNSLLRMKADFIPQLEDEEDISYFDSRDELYKNRSSRKTDSQFLRSLPIVFGLSYKKVRFKRPKVLVLVCVCVCVCVF